MEINFNDLSHVSSEDGYSDGNRDYTLADRQLVVVPPVDRQLVVLPPAETDSFSQFMLHDEGCIVKAVPRSHAAKVDKRSRYSKYIMSGGKAINLDEDEHSEKPLSLVKSNVIAGMSIGDLPDGWIIEKVPRRLTGSDKYYWEPGTGLKFRSLVEVQRHLEEDAPLSNRTMSMNMYRKKKDVSRKIIQTESCDGNDPSSSSSAYQRPCSEEVNWILSSSGGDVWHPFSVEIPVSGCVNWIPVPGFVKQRWNQRFMDVMNGYY